MIQNSLFFLEEHQQLFTQRLPDLDQIRGYSVTINRGYKIKVKNIGIDGWKLIYSKKKMIDLQNVYLKFSNGNLILSRNSQSIEMGGEGIFEIYNNIKKYCFSLLNQLGQGKQGIVQGIKRNQDGEIFACKSIKKNQYSTNLEIRAIKLEIEILRKLDHPNIIQLLETYEDEQQIHLVFEQLNGGQLQQDIVQEQLGLRIFKPIFKAIMYLHSKSIFHRDIKFSNIMFKRKDDWDSACLVDFGLADYWNIIPDYIFYRCGTPGYVAPEILKDQFYLLNVDIYSLGLCLYKLLTGNMAFTGSCEDEVILKNYYGKIDFYKLNVSPNCLDLMKKILTLDYKKRISAENILNHPIYQDEQQHSFRIVRTKKLQKIGNYKSLCALPNSTDSSPIQFNKRINCNRFQLRKLY